MQAVTDYAVYRNLLSKITRRNTFTFKHPKLEGDFQVTFASDSLTTRSESTGHDSSSQLSYGLGSGLNGQQLSQVPCANAANRGHDESCGLPLLRCAHCPLVKYCSGRCQRQHWQKHQGICEHPFQSSDWEPDWLRQGRKPFLNIPRFLPLSTSIDPYKNPGFLPYDVLQLYANEGKGALQQDLKLCFVSMADIRNLVQTINHLPQDYIGKLDILINNPNPLVLNRLLLILCVLLTPGPPIEEAAELAVHLMYSAFLSETAASYIRYCVNLLYGSDTPDPNGDLRTGADRMAFQRSLRTRGLGKVYCVQPASGIKRVVEMYQSTYGGHKAMKSRSEVLQDPLHIDDRHNALANLKHSHRMVLARFWETGVLAPYSLDVGTFTQPNRTMFDVQGEWLSDNLVPNPIQGWNVSAVRKAGEEYIITEDSSKDPSKGEDILGCLFFHLKYQFSAFTQRIKDHPTPISLHLTQYDAQILSKGISVGVLPSFADASFDRIDLGDMMDQAGVRECVSDWGSLLNPDNPSACLIMHSKKWHQDMPGVVTRDNPKAIQIIKDRCKKLPGLRAQLKQFLRGNHSPALTRLISSLDAFIDHEPSFMEYLKASDLDIAMHFSHLQLRLRNTIHAKRIGISQSSSLEKLPQTSKEEFYDIFTLAGADLALRFIELERSS